MTTEGSRDQVCLEGLSLYVSTTDELWYTPTDYLLSLNGTGFVWEVRSGGVGDQEGVGRDRVFL